MKQSIFIAIIVSIQLVAQFCGQLIIIAHVGVGGDTDVFIAAQAIPAVMNSIIITALQSIWLPRLSVTSNELKIWREELNKSQGQATLIGGGLYAISAYCAKFYIPPLYPGFDQMQHLLIFKYTCILIIAAMFYTQSSLLTLAMRTNGRYLSAELIPALSMIFYLLAIYYALPAFGIDGVVWLTLIRSFLVYLVQLHLLNWPLMSFKSIFRDSESLKLMRPVFLGASVLKTSTLIDKYWCSQGSLGSVTVLNIAQTGMGALAIIIERTLIVPISSKFARSVADGEYHTSSKIIKRVAIQCALVIFSMALFLVFAKSEILKLLVLILDLDVDNANKLWWASILLLGYVFSSAYGSLIIMGFNCMKKPEIPVKIGILGFLLSIILKSAAYIFFDFIGLILAISAYYIINIIFIFFAFNKKIKNSNLSIMS